MPNYFKSKMNQRKNEKYLDKIEVPGIMKEMQNVLNYPIYE